MQLQNAHTRPALRPSTKASRRALLHSSLEADCRGALRGLGWVIVFYIMLSLLAALGYWVSIFSFR